MFLEPLPRLFPRAVYGITTYRLSLTTLVIKLAIFSSGIQYASCITSSLKASTATLESALKAKSASLRTALIALDFALANVALVLFPWLWVEAWRPELLAVAMVAVPSGAEAGARLVA